VSDVLEDGDIKVKKIHTKNNPVDMLTKVVPGSSSIIVKTCSESFRLLELNEAHLNRLREA